MTTKSKRSSNISIAHEEYKCIYCLKTEPEVTFEKQEHIILRTIGGQRKLPNGYVCDICNHGFSVIEKRFTHESIVSVLKQFYGPSGRHGKFISRLHPISSSNGNDFAIGYVEQGGIPHHVNQINILDNGNVRFVGTNYSKEWQDDLLEKVKSTSDDSIIRKSFSELPENFLSILTHQNKLFVFFGSSITNENISNGLSILRNAKITFDLETAQASEYQPKVHQEITHDRIDYDRIICKMIFNMYAYFHYKEALNERFNRIRDFVHHGNSREFIFVQHESVSKQIISSIASQFLFDEMSHLIIAIDYPEQHGLLGLIRLYGQLSYAIRFDDETAAPHNCFRIICCDFRNKHEFEVIEDQINRSRKARKMARKNDNI